MRRTDREVPDRGSLEGIIDSCEVCRLGLSFKDRPYIVPLNFVRAGGSVLFHSALEGKKLDILRHNPKVCLEFDHPGNFKGSTNPCKTGFSYISVIAFGNAEILEDTAAKREALSLLTRKYAGRKHTFSESEAAGVAIIKVVIEEMTGKRSDPRGEGAPDAVHT